MREDSPSKTGANEGELDEVTVPAIAWVALCFIALVCVVYGCFVWPQLRASDGAQWGSFGDAYGVLGASFTALAFWAMGVTMWMQREDLKVTKREMLAAKKLATEQHHTTLLQAETVRESARRDLFAWLLGEFRAARDSLGRDLSQGSVVTLECGDELKIRRRFETLDATLQALVMHGSAAHTVIQEGVIRTNAYPQPEAIWEALADGPARYLCTLADQAIGVARAAHVSDDVSARMQVDLREQFIASLGRHETLMLAVAGRAFPASFPQLGLESKRLERHGTRSSSARASQLEIDSRYQPFVSE